MAQQTAVDWLIKELELEGYDHTIEIAKQMQKEQIQKAFSDGQELPINNPILPHYSSEEYYNENYNK